MVPEALLLQFVNHLSFVLAQQAGMFQMDELKSSVNGKGYSLHGVVKVKGPAQVLMSLVSQTART